MFGDQVTPFEKWFIHHEPLQKRSALYNYEITEHLHTNLVQLFLITSGGGLLLTLGKKIALETPCVLVIPNNILHGFVFSSEVRGDVFTLSDAKFDQLLQNAPYLFSAFENLQHIPFDPGSELFVDLLDIQRKILLEMKRTDKAAGHNLSLLFQMYLVNLYRSKQTVQTAVIQTDDKTLGHFYVFKKLIKQNIHGNKSVQFFANEMDITTVHLNRICKMVAQKTALQIIHEEIIKEARQYLKGTSHSVAEIAYFLDFKNPAHFSKFFKKLVGDSPRKFRVGR